MEGILFNNSLNNQFQQSYYFHNLSAHCAGI